MAITEKSRYRLHSQLKTTLGDEEAATLMEHLPPVGWADVATKQDLAQLGQLIDHRFQSTEQRIRADFFRSQKALALTLVGTNVALLAIGLNLVQR